MKTWLGMRVNKDTLKAMFALDIPFECIYKTTWWLYDESYILENIEGWRTFLRMAVNRLKERICFDKWQFGILKDSTHKAREVLSTSLATEFAIRSFHAMVFTTISANNITVRPTSFDDCLLTFLF